MIHKALVLLASCAPVFAQEWNEQAVLDLFDRQSPMRVEMRAAGAAALEAVRGRTLWPNPTATYIRETVGFTEFALGEQQIPWSGRLALERKALEPARESAEAQGAARIWEVRSSLRAAFYRALAAQAQETAFEASLREIQEIIELLRTREREGEGSRYDRIRVERELADLRADLALARARGRSERTFLLSYLPPQTELGSLRGELVSIAEMLPLGNLMERAMGSRAEIRGETSRLAQLGFEQQAADKMRVPEPTITAGLKRTQLFNTQNGSGGVVGVSIPLPFFNKGQTEVARIGAERERATARREIVAQQIRATVAGAYEVLAARRGALEAFERETGDAGAELLRVARVGYQEGELGILQVLDALRLRRQTAIRRIELQAAMRESEVELSRSAGFEVMK